MSALTNPNYDPDLPDGPYNDPGAPADVVDAIAEHTSNVGADKPDREWILSPYDTWEHNPHYTGPRGPHPESYSDESEAQAQGFSTAHYPTRGEINDEIPF